LNRKRNGRIGERRYLRHPTLIFETRDNKGGRRVSLGYAIGRLSFCFILVIELVRKRIKTKGRN
jgi:hypothetical protein